MNRLLVSALCIVAVAGTVAGRVAVERSAAAEPAERPLLYLPNGRHLRLASLGHAPLVADFLYLWAIQYYSDYERADRYQYVEHVFGNVIAELDPHYVDAYWLGALILIVENGDLDGGLRLLDRGFERNPDQWVLPYLAGWECYRAQQFTRAASYFERAGAVPDAPSVVLRMRAGMYAKVGDHREALRMWQEVLEDERSDAGARAIAERQIRDLRVKLDLAQIEEAVERFRRSEGRLPRELGELVDSGHLPGIVADPDGNPYGYDPNTGRVTSATARVLRPRS